MLMMIVRISISSISLFLLFSFFFSSYNLFLFIFLHQFLLCLLFLFSCYFFHNIIILNLYISKVLPENLSIKNFLSYLSIFLSVLSHHDFSPPLYFSYTAHLPTFPPTTFFLVFVVLFFLVSLVICFSVPCFQR